MSFYFAKLLWLEIEAAVFGAARSCMAAAEYIKISLPARSANVAWLFAQKFLIAIEIPPQRRLGKKRSICIRPVPAAHTERGRSRAGGAHALFNKSRGEIKLFAD